MSLSVARRSIATPILLGLLLVAFALLALAVIGAHLADASPLIPLLGKDAEVTEVGRAELKTRTIDVDLPGAGRPLRPAGRDRQ